MQKGNSVHLRGKKFQIYVADSRKKIENLTQKKLIEQLFPSQKEHATLELKMSVCKTKRAHSQLSIFSIRKTVWKVENKR